MLPPCEPIGVGPVSGANRRDAKQCIIGDVFHECIITYSEVNVKRFFWKLYQVEVLTSDSPKLGVLTVEQFGTGEIVIPYQFVHDILTDSLVADSLRGAVVSEGVDNSVNLDERLVSVFLFFHVYHYTKLSPLDQAQTWKTFSPKSLLHQHLREVRAAAP